MLVSKNSEVKKNVIGEFVKVYKPFSKDIVDLGRISGVDEEFAEFAAQLLGDVLDKSVWLSTSSEVEDCHLSKEICLNVGDGFVLEEFLDLGYERVERVWNEGEISVLGDIVLIWGFSMSTLVRISLLDGNIESIDLIDIALPWLGPSTETL